MAVTVINLLIKLVVYKTKFKRIAIEGFTAAGAKHKLQHQDEQEHENLTTTAVVEVVVTGINSVIKRVVKEAEVKWEN